MAQLSSPGVAVTVVDESFYTPAAPGTVPLIVVATAANKMNSAGTGIAPGTMPANAGKVYLLTSQMDLGNTFGIPYFQTDAENNPVNAGELNEYGLQAAHSFLGVSNRAYVVRADVDTSQLHARAAAPTGLPADGTFWFDIADSNFGIFEWDGGSTKASDSDYSETAQSFVNQTITVITDATLVGENGGPIKSYGQVGAYAIVAATTDQAVTLWYKKQATDTLAGTWVEVGTSSWKASYPAAAGTIAPPATGGTAIGFGPATVFEGYISGTTLTITSAPTQNGSPATITPALTNGPLIVSNDTNYRSGTRITVQVDGTPGGIGTYTVSQSYPSRFPSGSGNISLSIDNTQADTFLINSVHIPVGSSSVADLASSINSTMNGLNIGISAAEFNGKLYIYSDGTANGGTGEFQLNGTAVSKLGLESSTTYYPPALQISTHFNVPAFKTTTGRGYGSSTTAGGKPSGSVWVKTTSVNKGANWVVKKYNASLNTWIIQSAPMYANGAAALAALDPKGGGANLSVGTTYVKYDLTGMDVADFKIFARSGVGATVVTSIPVTVGGSGFTNGTQYAFDISWSTTGASAYTAPTTITLNSGTVGSSVDATITHILEQFTNISDTNILAKRVGNTISISHLAGGDIVFTDGENGPLSKLFTADVTANYHMTDDGSSTIASLWVSTIAGQGFIVPSLTPPTTTPEDQTLWYNSDITEVDIMVNAGPGNGWVGYRTAAGKAVVNGGVSQTTTDTMGPIVSATAPKTQQDGSTALSHGDIWVSTTDLEMFPTIYRWDELNKKWVQIDTADQTTSQGIVFADARWSDNSMLGTPQTGAGAPDAIADLLNSSYVDPDVEDPALFPTGILLWNLRRSGYNVKKYVKNYIDTTALNTMYGNALMTNYHPDRWVSDAPNQIDGAGTFGRKAQRAVVLKALTATIESNQNIRQPDTVIYNLLSCPGYLETLSPLISLNTDNGQSAFIVADSPARLTPDATSLSNWGNNVNGAAVDGDEGLIATNSYAAVYYPWGYTQDLTGNNVVVPPSHIMLRTIALSDNVSYPWFAPAGVRRGGVTNASSVGYVDGQTGEFHTVALNGGQRDTLAGIHVNPITYLAGTGLVCYGQYTRQLVASSLDRINVARLVIYLRYQLNKIAKPFIFEPNDTITRNEIKQQIENMLLELVGQRALYDFLVVCDKSNNTPARIDRNELHVDIAIEPVKSVEFIYIPMRLENTGAIAGLGA